MDRKKARKKATELVSQMTLEEKASQLRYDAPAIKRLGIPAYNWWNEALHGVARAGQAQFSRRQLDLAPLLTPNFWDRLQIPLLPKVVPNTMHIPRKKTVTFTKVLPSGRQT